MMDFKRSWKLRLILAILILALELFLPIYYVNRVDLSLKYFQGFFYNITIEGINPFNPLLFDILSIIALIAWIFLGVSIVIAFLGFFSALSTRRAISLNKPVKKYVIVLAQIGTISIIVLMVMAAILPSIIRTGPPGSFIIPIIPIILIPFISFQFLYSFFYLPEIPKEKQKEEVQPKKEEIKIKKEEYLRNEIIKASITYTSIPFKKLAKIIGCNDKLLLKTLSDMIFTHELDAEIEYPTINFKRKNVV